MGFTARFELGRKGGKGFGWVTLNAGPASTLQSPNRSWFQRTPRAFPARCGPGCSGPRRWRGAVLWRACRRPLPCAGSLCLPMRLCPDYSVWSFGEGTYKATGMGLFLPFLPQVLCPSQLGVVSCLHRRSLNPVHSFTLMGGLYIEYHCLP